MNITDKIVSENIKKEIEIWSKINNTPNIVKLIDYEYTNQYVSILMEICSGKKHILIKNMKLIFFISN